MIGTHIKIILCALVIFVFTQQAVGQTRIWTGFSMEADLKKSMSLNFKSQLRDELPPLFSNGFDHLYQIALEKKLAKRFLGSIGYRLSMDTELIDANRLFADLKYKSKRKKRLLRYSFRLRGQHSVRANEKRTLRTYLRFKPTLSVNASKLVDPYVAMEWFYRFNEKNEMRKFRFILGANWRISKQLKLKSFFMTQKELNVRTPETSNVVGVQLSLKI